MAVLRLPAAFEGSAIELIGGVVAARSVGFVERKGAEARAVVDDIVLERRITGGRVLDADGVAK